jgi:phenylacetate-CoA ligase
MCFPSQIESVLMETEDVEPHYQLVVDRVDNLDVLTVMVEVDERSFTDEVKGLQAAGAAHHQKHQGIAGRVCPG